MDRDRDREEEEEPQLCVKGCGFYGSPENLNMCSKCYRDHKKKQQPEEEEEEEEEEEVAALTSKLHINGDGSATDGAVEEEATAAQAASAAVVVPRCVRCSKKVSMYGFKCRCGSLCCARHRYPEEHGCSFDFKAAGRISLAKANVLVKPDKLEDRII